MEIQMYSCCDAEATGSRKHNATQLFQEQSDTKEGMVSWEQHMNVNVLCQNSYASNNTLAEMFLVKLCNINTL